MTEQLELFASGASSKRAPWWWQPQVARLIEGRWWRVSSPCPWCHGAFKAYGDEGEPLEDVKARVFNRIGAHWRKTHGPNAKRRTLHSYRSSTDPRPAPDHPARRSAP